MFRTIISPILRSLCYTAPMMLPAGDQDEVELHLIQATTGSIIGAVYHKL